MIYSRTLEAFVVPFLSTLLSYFVLPETVCSLPFACIPLLFSLLKAIFPPLSFKCAALTIPVPLVRIARLQTYPPWLCHLCLFKDMAGGQRCRATKRISSILQFHTGNCIVNSPFSSHLFLLPSSFFILPFCLEKRRDILFLKDYWGKFHFTKKWTCLIFSTFFN